MPDETKEEKKQPLKLGKPKQATKKGEWMYGKVNSTLEVGGQVFRWGDSVEEWPQYLKEKYKFSIKQCPKARPEQK